jgi:hypothetical protein
LVWQPVRPARIKAATNAAAHFSGNQCRFIRILSLC